MHVISVEISTANTSDQATVSTLTATNSTLTSALTACQIQIVKALQNVTKFTTSLANLNRNHVHNYPTPKLDTTAGPTDTCRTTLAVTVNTLKKFMAKEQQRLTPKESQLRINPAENGWGINIRKKLQTQQHPSPQFPTLLPLLILAAQGIF